MTRTSDPVAAPAVPPAAAGRTHAPAHETQDGSDGSDVSRILQRAVDEAVLLLEADGALIGLLDDEGHLRFAFEAGMTESRVQRWRTTLEAGRGERGGLIARAIAMHEVQRTDDYPNDRSFEHSERADDLVAEVGIRSLVAAPLIVGGRSVGALAIHADRPSAFSERDIVLIRALADHAAAAIETADLIERLARVEIGYSPGASTSSVP